MGFEYLENGAITDEIDLQIIKILNQDGRATFAQIAQVLGVSAGMVRQRYHRLVEEGIVQVVAITNPMLMGYTTMAQIGVKVNVNRMQYNDLVTCFDQIAGNRFPHQTKADTANYWFLCHRLLLEDSFKTPAIIFFFPSFPRTNLAQPGNDPKGSPMLYLG